MDHLVNPKIDQINEQVNPIPRMDDLFGMIETVSVAPTAAPTRYINQFKIYSNGGTYRLYVYDTVGQAWHYASLT